MFNPTKTESEQTDPVEPCYREPREFVWRDTPHDDALLFSNVQASEEGSQAIINHSSGDVFSKFKPKVNNQYSKGQLLYSKADDKFYKVIDIQMGECEDL